MNKYVVRLCCCFILKKKNRKHFREKYYKNNPIVEINNNIKNNNLTLNNLIIKINDLTKKILTINTGGICDYSNYLTYFGQFVPKVQLDKIVYQRYFKDKIVENGVCLECGANDGISGTNGKFFEETLGWNIYNIEPTPDLFKKCCENRPNCHNFNFGLSDKRGELDFVANCNGLNGILEHANKNIRGRKGYENVSFDVIKIPVVTYKEFIETNNINHINYFSLDVERHERNVIKGMDSCSVLPDIFVLETNDKNGKEYSDLLIPMGYLYDFQYEYNVFYVRKDCAEKYGLKVI